MVAEKGIPDMSQRRRSDVAAMALRRRSDVAAMALQRRRRGFPTCRSDVAPMWRCDVAPMALRWRCDVAPMSPRRRCDVTPMSPRRRSDFAASKYAHAHWHKDVYWPRLARKEAAGEEPGTSSRRVTHGPDRMSP